MTLPLTGAGPSSPGFNPLSLSPTIWLKADALSLSDADPVTSWTDSSGNGNHATQGTAANKPTYKTGIVNGKPVVRFDGTDDQFALVNLSALTAGTVFIVVKLDTDPPAADAQTGLWNLGTDASNSTHFPYVDGVVYDTFGSAVRKTVGNPGPSLASAFRIYAVRSVASSWECWLSGVSLFSTGTNTVGFPASPTLGKSATVAFLDGDLAEFLLYGSGLSTTDRQAVESYLTAKYAL